MSSTVTYIASKYLRPQYYHAKVEGLKESNPRGWWKETKKMLGQCKPSDESLKGLANDLCEGDYKILANKINNVFHSVSSDLPRLDASSLPPACEFVPDQYIISLQEVEKKLMDTNVQKAIGPDYIPNWVLRDLAGLISKPVCCIMNSSIREGLCPTMWKSANVCSIPKVNPPRSVGSDLRPISLTPTLSKQLESFIGKWLWDILEPKIGKDQFGGIRKCSTTHALIEMLHHWHVAAENGKITRVLLIDYSKAFDHVDHIKLLEKLKAYDVPAILLRWVGSFLSDRRQRVRVGQEISDWLSQNGGVPQGSYLGPLLFVVMINDLQLDEHLLHKYMDDGTVSEFCDHPGQSDLQSSADHIQDWSSDNNMFINAIKTKELVLSFKKGPHNMPAIILNNSAIEQVKTAKTLGVYISDDLKWDTHIDYIKKKASKRLYFLTCLKRAGVRTTDLILYYTSVIRSVLEYACPVWHSGLTIGQRDLLEYIQKRALFTIFPNTTYQEALSLSNLPSLHANREKLCKRFYDSMQSPNHRLHYLLPPPKESHYSLRHQTKYEYPQCKTNRMKSSFVPYAIFTFN